jgi:glycosyltransferase involved in cell wall biosynthesis
MPLIQNEDANAEFSHILRQDYDINGPIVMYVGNLEAYQGIDLLLDSVAILANRESYRFNLVIIGGTKEGVQKYSAVISKLKISELVFLIGHRPLELLSNYLSQADILVSPRLKGVNTPMKLFSYLQSGKPTLVTNLVTHTQVVSNSTAFLAEPNPEAFAEGLATLLTSPELCNQLGKAGKELIDNQYSLDAFTRKFNKAMSWLERELQSSYR